MKIIDKFGDGYFEIREGWLFSRRITIFDLKNSLLHISREKFLVFSKATNYRFSEIDSYDTSHHVVEGDNCRYDLFSVFVKLESFAVVWRLDTESYGDFIKVNDLVSRALKLDNVSKSLDVYLIQCSNCKRTVSKNRDRCIYCGCLRQNA